MARPARATARRQRPAGEHKGARATARATAGRAARGTARAHTTQTRPVRRRADDGGWPSARPRFARRRGRPRWVVLPLGRGCPSTNAPVCIRPPRCAAAGPQFAHPAAPRPAPPAHLFPPFQTRLWQPADHPAAGAATLAPLRWTGLTERQPARHAVVAPTLAAAETYKKPSGRPRTAFWRHWLGSGRATGAVGPSSCKATGGGAWAHVARRRAPRPPPPSPPGALAWRAPRSGGNTASMSTARASARRSTEGRWREPVAPRRWTRDRSPPLTWRQQIPPLSTSVAPIIRGERVPCQGANFPR